MYIDCWIILFCEVPVHFFAHFFVELSVFFFDFGEFFIYSEYESFFVQVLQIFPQPWDLPFQSVNSVFDRQVYDFKVI